MLYAKLFGVTWMDPNWLLDQFGPWFVWVCLLMVLIECGLFFPVLPGDTLLFAVGLFVSTRDNIIPGPSVTDLPLALLLLTAAAFAGNVLGYEIGRAVGPPIYEREGRIIKRAYFDKTAAFFDQHGNKALVIGRFVPFVRTYITVVAGVTRMRRRRFFLWSLVGATLWVLSITLLGYFLGRSFPGLGANIDKAILVILAFSLVPVVYEWRKHRSNRHRSAEPASGSRSGSESGSQPVAGSGPESGSGAESEADETPRESRRESPTP